MKNFKRYIGFAAIIALLFTSCSKDEESGIIDSEKVTLSFGAIVNDLVANRDASRQAEADLPVCSDDEPAYVRIVLMQGDNEVVGTSGNPYRIDLVSGQVYTKDDPALELDPGMYSLEHLSVYNSDGDLIWIAPRVGSIFEEFVDQALPISIDLRAGVKKYVDVPVLCFDDRDVNEYGYLFFELDTNIALTYCFFANYCNEDGRHFPARYSVSIWSGTSSAGVLLYSNEENTVGQHDNGDYFATPLCFAVPDHSNMDTPYLYYEVTLLDWEDVYGDVEQTVLSGTITKRMITDNFGDEDDTDYHHLRFGCGDDDGEPPVDSDGDGVPDSRDDCPNTPANTEVDSRGCPVTTPCDQTAPEADCDNDGTPNKCDTDNPNWDTFDCDGDGFLNGVDFCPNVAGVAGGDGGDGCPEGTTDPCANLPAPCTIQVGELGEDCYLTELADSNSEGYLAVSADGTINLLNIQDDPWGVVTVSRTGGDLTISLDGELTDDRITAYTIEVRPSDNGSMSTSCWESDCNSAVAEANQTNPIVKAFTANDYSGTFYLKVTAVVCGEPVEGP